MRARAQFARDAAEARGWVADKLAKLQADKQGEVTDLEDKIKKLQKHQAFTLELAANSGRVREIEQLGAQLVPDEHVERQLEQLRDDWRQLEEATERRGRGLEEAQDILEFNQHLDKIEAWIRDKEMMVQAHELGRDYEHCSALLRKLDDLDSDMKVDDKHVKSICALADKLLQQGPTQQAATVAQRRDAFLAKWKALSGALQKYRDNLSAALEVHSFNRDVEDTFERIAKKAALFSSTERGREFSAAQELKRKHLARVAEASAVKEKIQQLEGEGRVLAHKHPERAKEIESSLQSLREEWAKLQQLAEARTALLDEAINEHKFDENLKELELWVSETVKRMSSTEPPETVSDAQALLEVHNDRKAEIDGRQKAIAALQTEQALVPEKKKKVEQLSSTLDQAWHERKQYLSQAHQLQLLKEQARQVEDWLAGKEAFLNNDDLGDNLDAVETLIRKHAEFSKLLESQLGRVQELEQMAKGVLQDQHYDVQSTRRRVNDILSRRDKLQESCKQRGEMLQQSKQLHQFLRDLNHEREWIALKMQVATDQNYRELSNLQSKIQKHAAFESELAANKGRIDDVANHGEELIEKNHYASREIATHVEELENQWRELQAAAKLRRERLQEAYQARVYLRGLDDFTAWLDEVETQLLSEDHGKDLTSVSALLKRHSRLEQQVSSKADTATQLADTATQLAEDGHFMAEEILEKANHAVKRYRQLQEPMQIRRDNLEDAALLHRWERDADEEIRWMREREGAVRVEDAGNTLPEAQALLKKHLALEAELLSREPAVKALVGRAAQLARRGHFAAGPLEARARDLGAGLRALLDAARLRQRRLRERGELLQLLAEMAEAEAWVSERRVLLVSSDVGRDEASALSLAKRLDALQRELQGFDADLGKLEKSAAALMERPTIDNEHVKGKMHDLKNLYEEMKLLSAQRQQRLQQSLKYFKFVQECEEVQEWIGEQMSAAASEEYGLDVEHVETLQQAFENFLAQLHANEGRIEAVCEAGNTLLEENTPEAKRVQQRIEDIRGLWDDLKELALARNDALAGARQVHEFDRSVDETAAWVAEKESALATETSPPRSLHELHASRRRLDALQADVEAIRAQHAKLQQEAEKLGTAFPDAKEHVSSKLEDVTEALEDLSARAEQCVAQLELAGQLQHLFGTYQELLAWTNETLARVTAPELAADVSGAERLLARHRDVGVEIHAKDDAFKALYADGEKLVKEGHFMAGEIEERMSTLRARRQQLDAAYNNRASIYERHLDALIFKRDADALDNWIATRMPLVRDGKYGESVAQVEELINRHKDLEETIESQKDKFSGLKRITLPEGRYLKKEDVEQQIAVWGYENLNHTKMEDVKKYKCGFDKNNQVIEKLSKFLNTENEVGTMQPTTYNVLYLYCRETLFSKIKNRNTKQPNKQRKRLIISIPENLKSEFIKKIGFNNQEINSQSLDDFSNSFKDLDEISRRQLIEHDRIKIGGFRITDLLSMNELDLCMRDKILLKFILNELEINDDKVERNRCDEAVQQYYTDRSLLHVIVDRGIEKDPLFHVVRGYTRHEEIKQQEVVVVSSDEKLFDHFHKKYSHVHWLMEINNKYVWMTTKGTLTNLRKYVTEQDPGLDLNSNAEMYIPVTNVSDVKNNVLLISANPGMGKSILLSHIVKQSKKKDNSFLVVKANLTDGIDKLESLKAKENVTLDQAIHYLFISTQIESSQIEESESAFSLLTVQKDGYIAFSRNDDFDPLGQLRAMIFCNLYNKEKIVLLLDGFDEMAPNYCNVTLKLLEKLKQSKLRYPDAVNTKDSKGRTALDYAIENKNEPLVTLLPESKVRADIRDKTDKMSAHINKSKVNTTCNFYMMDNAIDNLKLHQVNNNSK
ncbi:spectrin alpha chain-like [Hyposmocoma kahamanoa]|uniref:spectrin alpha chain-like n=1 Tax=Hyposmocoma kahamanoa TaxID=1477025 RepID=UPI000E6D8DA0|nr:spectrin alpha chain-like [Hyposmocoma kahamanoa]